MRRPLEAVGRHQAAAEHAQHRLHHGRLVEGARVRDEERADERGVQQEQVREGAHAQEGDGAVLLVEQREEGEGEGGGVLRQAQALILTGRAPGEVARGGGGEGGRVGVGETMMCQMAMVDDAAQV